MNKRVMINRIVLVLLSIGVLWFSFMSLYKMVSTDYELYLHESKCVSYYVYQGYERSQIITENGECYVKGKKSKS